MTEQREAPSHFRGQPRPRRAVDVSFRVDGDERPERVARTANLGVGGAFIITDEAPPLGARLSLRLALPGGHSVTLRAEVRRHADDKEDKRGMGLEFVEVDTDLALVLDDYLATLPEPDGGGAFDDVA